jgi:hypothetical protein
MGIDVQLRDGTGQVLAEVADGRMTLARAAQSGFPDSRLLKYLVPWGDVVFNQTQAGDLAADIRALKDANPGGALFDMLSKVQPLVARLSAETHLYLWFVGD